MGLMEKIGITVKLLATSENPKSSRQTLIPVVDLARLAVGASFNRSWHRIHHYDYW